MRLPKHEVRTTEQIVKHYEIEKELARKLRNSNKEDRLTLYTKLYDELFRLVPNHPLLIQKEIFQDQGNNNIEQIKLLERFLNHDNLQPDNFQLIISDGCSIPVDNGSVDVAYSNDLMEHLHPEDAFEQLKNIYNALKSDGVYICHTPNKLSGPHDVSKYFDFVATGFHLKEYTIGELVNMFKSVGFTKLELIIAARNIVLPISLPVFPFRLLETLLCWLPIKIRRKISKWLPIRVLLGIHLVATK